MFLCGETKTTTGDSIHSNFVTVSHDIAVAVVARAIIWTLDGTNALISPRLEYSTRNCFPLIRIVGCIM